MRTCLPRVTLLLLCCGLALVSAGGCEPVTCDVAGEEFEEGDIFPAGDGCNECACLGDGTVACTRLACVPGEGEGEGEGDAGEGEGEGEGDGEPELIAPVPDVDCDATLFEEPDGRRVYFVDDSVVLPPGTAAADVAGRTWSIARAPARARATLIARDAETAELRSQSFGVYVLQLDAVVAGTAFSGRCALRDFPSDGLVVELTWDGADGDYDLHVTKAGAGGALCVNVPDGELPAGGAVVACGAVGGADGDDCNYTNCRANGAGVRPEWDGVAGVSEGDPTLLIDDINGFGPETIVVPSPAPGSYGVVVHAFNGANEHLATARLWLGGQLAGSASAPLIDGQAFVAFTFDIADAAGVDTACVDAAPGDPGDPEGPVCRVVPSCAPSAICAQCVDDAGCGAGTVCDAQAALCVSADATCVDDGSCLCPSATDVCTAVACVGDGECGASGPGAVCIAETGLCSLDLGGEPPPVCPEDLDEPNDTPAEAAPFGLAAPFSGALCRGDVDVHVFDVVPERRYVVTVDFGGSGQPGIVATLLDGQEVPQSSATLAATDARATLVSITPAGAGAGGVHYVVVDATGASGFDQRSYVVSVVEEEPGPLADCTAAGQSEEPNDDFATATPLVLDGPARTFARCGDADVDFYRVTVPPLTGVQVVLDAFANADGNLNIDLFDAPTLSARVDTGIGVNDIEQLDGPELPGDGVVAGGGGDYWVRVFLASTAGAVEDQSYRVTTQSAPRPAACAGDVEDDGSIAQATPLPLVDDGSGDVGASVVDVVRCNPQDRDHFRFTLPATRGAVVRLRFVHAEGDMALDVLDAVTGAVVGTSNVSSATSDPDEQVAVPSGAADADYVVRARLATASGGVVAQRYTVEVVTFDDAQCVVSEPAGGDDTFVAGRCIGDWAPLQGDACVNGGSRIVEPMLPPDLATCAAAAPGSVDGCGLVCGNDDADWYRVGPLAEEAVLHAELAYDFAAGELALVRGVLNANGTVTETTTADADDDGFVAFSFVSARGAPRELGVRVRAVGTTGHVVQPYALRVEVGPQCFDDDNDAGAASNASPATATVIRPVPEVGVPFVFDSASGSPPAAPLSRCNNDVDVYELLAFAGETVGVELDQLDASPGALLVELGTRPADLNDPAVVVASAAAGGAPLTFDNVTAQTLYVTVRAPTGVAVTGPYVLLVTTTPAP